jgi:hypothetical protein
MVQLETFLAGIPEFWIPMAVRKFGRKEVIFQQIGFHDRSVRWGEHLNAHEFGVASALENRLDLSEPQGQDSALDQDCDQQIRDEIT